VGPDRGTAVTGQDRGRDDATVAAVLRLTDLAAKVERAEATATRRIDELAVGCAAATEQITGLRDALGAFGGRADEIERRLAEVGAVLERMSGQISALTAAPEESKGDGPGYQVNPVSPWWKPGDERCRDTAARLADWVAEVYRPMFGYLAGLLAPCWQQHPLCLAYLDVVHEAWCLLYLNERDPKMVFAQLDWLTRSLLQAAEVMANETRPCRDRRGHRDPGQEAAASPAAPWTSARR
jgi:hypothetical protein